MLGYGFAPRGAPEQLWLGGWPPWPRWPRWQPTAPHPWSRPSWTDHSDREQLALFEPPVRDWTRIGYAGLPPLSVTAPHLHAALNDHAAVHRWARPVLSETRRRLEIAAAVLGVEKPFREEDMRALPRGIRTIGHGWLLEFLDTHGQLARNATPKIGGNQRRVTEMLNDAPKQFRDDVRAWVAALRGEGIRPSPALQWASVRTYVTFALPALCEWGERYGSLREVTSDDVTAAIYARPGCSRRSVQTALRSLFRGLKRERRIFADPAARVSVRLVTRLPRPLPSDRLRGLLDRLDKPRDRLITALVAVHALGVGEVQALLLDDLNRHRGTLRVHRRGRDVTVVLDELILRLITDWLRVRARQWPVTSNPFLLISKHTALGRNSMSRFGLTAPFRILGITAAQLRTDRILDEARYTGDPVQLVRVFGLGVTTAVSYTRAAHPDKFRLDPAGS